MDKGAAGFSVSRKEKMMGASGYMRDYPLERMLRDAKWLQILEGTPQIQQVGIARALLDQ